METFIVMTSRGLEEYLIQELEELGIKDIEKHSTGAQFKGTFEDCYKVNLHSRIATRVLWPRMSFRAFGEDELYEKIKKHDFTQYIEVNQTLAINASATSKKFTDQRFVAMKVKDAIVDQFREKFEERPDVSKDNPDLSLYVRVLEHDFELSINMSGEALFRRGYRKESVIAPLKEHVAAALLRISGWDPKTPLIDLMCGSGTILIEAAMIAHNVAPGLNKKSFGFQKLKNYDSAVWNRLVEEALDKETEPDGEYKQFWGFDVDKKAVSAAKTNAFESGLFDSMFFNRLSVELAEPPEDLAQGMIILNPPYGERLGDDELLMDVYRNLGYTLKAHFAGWTCWVLSGHKELAQHIGMKSTLRVPLMNGSIDCRFLKYEVRKI